GILHRTHVDSAGLLPALQGGEQHRVLTVRSEAKLSLQLEAGARPARRGGSAGGGVAGRSTPRPASGLARGDRARADAEGPRRAGPRPAHRTGSAETGRRPLERSRPAQSAENPVAKLGARQISEIMRVDRKSTRLNSSHEWI